MKPFANTTHLTPDDFRRLEMQLFDSYSPELRYAINYSSKGCSCLAQVEPLLHSGVPEEAIIAALTQETLDGTNP